MTATGLCDDEDDTCRQDAAPTMSISQLLITAISCLLFKNLHHWEWYIGWVTVSRWINSLSIWLAALVNSAWPFLCC